MSVVNYEGIEIPNKQIKAFRKILQLNWEETLAKNPRGTSKGWNKPLLEVTEGRRSFYKNGKRTFFYSWCGDWVSYHLYKAGCLHTCLNRENTRGKWLSGMNLTLPRVWAGDSRTRRWAPKSVKKEFPASGVDAWHPWDNVLDMCADAYEPQLGDLVLCPRKNGDHIEFWVDRKDQILTVSAGAQTGGMALIRERDLDVENLVGIIDVSKLCPSAPF